MPIGLLRHTMNKHLPRCWAFLRGYGRQRLGTSGSVSLMFAAAVLPLTIAVVAGVDFSRLAATRAALQRAVDSAALSGAAAYALNSTAFHTLAITTATSAFCSATKALPAGAAMVQGGAQGCGSAPGPGVTAVTDSFIVGTPGISHNAGVSCSSGYLPPAPYTCGFIVTVSASAVITPMLPFLFGASITVSTQGMAANPFVNFADVFHLPDGIDTNAKYANSVWAYPLSLNADGGIDYSANAGALPDTSACTGGPDQIACGNYVMLASTMYAKLGTGYTPPGQSVIYDNGVVRNPVSPTQITATTRLGIAFRSIAGGNYVQHTPPGVYGYEVVTSPTWYNPSHYVYAPNGCIYPYSNLAYTTVGQVWTTGGATPPYTPVLPWTLVTHWFYSSYLSQNLPPSQGEILAQTFNNEDIPSVTNDPAQTGANIGGGSYPTYNANPSPAVATSCPATTTHAGVTTSNNLFKTTTFPTSSTTTTTNCSLYVGVSSSSTYTAPNYSGSCFDPANTPGQQYTSMSCQQYGSDYYTYYWNDMGGYSFDNKNYADGSVSINCSGLSHVILIN